MLSPSLASFKIFFFFLNFSEVWMWCSQVLFLFVLFYLAFAFILFDVLWASWICSWRLTLIWGNRLNCSKHCFCSFSFFSFSCCYYLYIIPFVVTPQFLDTQFPLFNFSLCFPVLEVSIVVSFRMDWLDLLAVKTFLQHHSLKASILWHSAFFIVQLSHPYMITGKP